MNSSFALLKDLILGGIITKWTSLRPLGPMKGTYLCTILSPGIFKACISGERACPVSQSMLH